MEYNEETPMQEGNMHCQSGLNSVQEIITDLQEDLMVVLDGHMDEMDMQEVFYNSIKFMTFVMYECLEDHELSLETLRLAMVHGIQMHIDNKEK